MDHLEKLNSFYEKEGLEELRLEKDGAHYLEYRVASRYLKRYVPAGAAVLDSCAGSGVYAFDLAAAGRKVTAGDIVPYNVDIMRQRQLKDSLLHDIYQGDARDLSRFADGAFDCVLCMGALYHFNESEDRARIISESLRVLKGGGIFISTYMNRYAVILGNAQDSLDNIDEILAFSQSGIDGIFYASTPREMESEIAAGGAEKLCHIALDGLINFLHGSANLLNKKGAERWQRYHLATCEKPSLLGYSYHNMIVAEKGVG